MQRIRFSGENQNLSTFLRVLVLNGGVHVVDAMKDESLNWADMRIQGQNLNDIIEKRTMRHPVSVHNFEEDDRLLENLCALFGIEKNSCSECRMDEYDYDKIMYMLRHLPQHLLKGLEAIKIFDKELKTKQMYLEHLRYMDNLDGDISGLLCMKHVLLEVLEVPTEDYLKLKECYESFPGIVLHVSDRENHTVLVMATVDSLKREYDFMVDSMQYKRIEMPMGYSGSLGEIEHRLCLEVAQIENHILQQKKGISSYETEYMQLIKKALAAYDLELETEKLRLQSAVGNHRFVVCGRISEADSAQLCRRVRERFNNEIEIRVEKIPRLKNTGKEYWSKGRKILSSLSASNNISYTMDSNVNSYLQMLVDIDKQAERMREEMQESISEQSEKNEQMILSLRDKLKSSMEKSQNIHVDNEETLKDYITAERTNYENHLSIQDERFRRNKQVIVQSLYEELF